MKYTEHQPSQELERYIDAYWQLETDALLKPFTRRIFADGCTDIIINIGKSVPLVNGGIKLTPGNMYLGGTMTCANMISSLPNTSIIGIRFKPGGFFAFYNLPARELVDKILPFPDDKLMKIIDVDENLSKRLDQFFSKKLSPVIPGIIPVTETVEKYKGIISVDFLASTHNVSNRTLERSFKQQIGISPKEFINIIKFTYAKKRIQKNGVKHSLLKIAFEMGYYDHSHLSREIRKYSGLNPSDIGSF